MRLLLILGGLAVLAMGVAITLVMMDNEPGSTGVGVAPLAADEGGGKPNKPVRKYKPQQLDRGKRAGIDLKKGKEQDQAAVDENTVMKFGQEFEKKWNQDRERLGKERHKVLEDLWFEGRRPRGAPEAMDKLEQILKEFPDTNRAGCAAFELGHHYIRARKMDLESRRKKAAEYWRMVEDRYKDTLCEYNAHAPAMSKMALATWVYRYTDTGEARRVLEEIIKEHPGETDHLGQPLEVTAKRLLEQLNK